MSVTAAESLVIVHHEHLIDARWSAADPAVLMVYRSVIVRDDHAIFRPVTELLESRPHSVEMDDVIEDPEMMFGAGRIMWFRLR